MAKDVKKKNTSKKAAKVQKEETKKKDQRE